MEKFKSVQSSSEDKKTKLEELFLELESGLNLAGVSAVEDKLQEGVPETIELLLKSNIRVWVLTGDKEVINIYKYIYLIGNCFKYWKNKQINRRNRQK